MYSKLALIPIDEHKYSKPKDLERSVPAALSYANETPIHTLMPTDKLSNSNWAQGHSSADRNCFTLYQGQPGFSSSFAFCAREHIKGVGCLESSITMTGSNFIFYPQCRIHTRRMKTTHASDTYSLQSLACRFYTFASERPFSAQTTLSFCAAQTGSRVRTHLGTSLGSSAEPCSQVISLHPRTRSEQKVAQNKSSASPRCEPDAALLKLYTVPLPTTRRSQHSLRLLFSLLISCSV